MRNATREFYIPAKSTKFADKNSSAVAYIFEMAGAPYAKGFRGKAAKPDFYHRFKTEADRTKFVKNWMAKVAQSEKVAADYKAKQKAARQTPHGWEVGLILQGSWGYEQTNVNFFEVTKVISPTMVEIEQIGSMTSTEDQSGISSMAAYVVPNPDARTGKKSRHKVVNGSIKSPVYGQAYVWKGKGVYSSWYA